MWHTPVWKSYVRKTASIAAKHLQHSEKFLENGEKYSEKRHGSWRKGMILPKERDPRFITIRRGGTLTDSDHHLLALWAAACAEHVLPLFESVRPDDPRPRQAIDAARAWTRGELKMMETRALGGHAMGAARDLRGATRFAAYAAGQAAVVAHVAAHELGGCHLRDSCRTRCCAERCGRACRAERVPLAARPVARGDSHARPRRPAGAQRPLLVRLRLLSAHQIKLNGYRKEWHGRSPEL